MHDLFLRLSAFCTTILTSLEKLFVVNLSPSFNPHQLSNLIDLSLIKWLIFYFSIFSTTLWASSSSQFYSRVSQADFLLPPTSTVTSFVLYQPLLLVCVHFLHVPAQYWVRTKCSNAVWWTIVGCLLKTYHNTTLLIVCDFPRENHPIKETMLPVLHPCQAQVTARHNRMCLCQSSLIKFM